MASGFDRRDAGALARLDNPKLAVAINDMESKLKRPATVAEWRAATKRLGVELKPFQHPFRRRARRGP